MQDDVKSIETGQNRDLPDRSQAVQRRDDVSVNGRTSYHLAMLLAFLSTLTLEIAVTDGDQPAWVVALIVACEATIVVILRMIVRWIDSSDNQFVNRHLFAPLRQGRDLRHEDKSPLIWILCLATAPFIVELLIRGATNTVLPLELLLLACFRDGVLALAVFSHRDDYQRMCCSLSTFLTIFASALSTHVWLHGLVVAFTIVGIWWLMGNYWDSLKGRLVATSEREPSRRWMIALPLVVLTLLLGLPVASTQTHALHGFMPSSGGSDRYSEAARSGVGDGDALVAGTDNIQSFAPIEDAPFLNSHEPSLFDLFDDSYDEPVKIKNQEQERAVALPSQLATKQKDHHLAESKQAGKEFSTLRKFGASKRGKIANLESNAILYVKGRVPLHLKLAVFDRYDGIDWFPESLSDDPQISPRLTIEILNDKPWLRAPWSRSLEIYRSPEIHALKIIRLDTNRIPSPTQLLGVHIDKVDREDFFDWAQPGIIRMNRDKLPSMIVVHLKSRVVDHRLIPKTLVNLSGGSPLYRTLGNDEQSGRIRELAQQWTKCDANSWSKVQTIVTRLRSEYVHDHDARPSANCNHTVAHFLFESRRGPDYQFASAAVLMLRSLGYSARLVSGFYVEPSRYDARSRHTAVVKENVHFWAEIYAGPDDWLPIDPTPGYELLQPPPTLSEQLFASGMSWWQWILTNRFAILLTTASMICLLRQRRFVLDRIATVVWRCWPARDEREFVQQTLRLLIKRCHRMDRPRLRGITPTRWLARIALCGNDAERQTVDRFTRLAEWANFGPSATSPPTDHCREICREAELIWSWKRIGRAISSPGHRPSHGPLQVDSLSVYQPVGCQ